MMSNHNIGFGTYRLPVEIAPRMVSHAIRIGKCRRIDTAQLYKNQIEVIREVRENHITDEIQITTKVSRKLIENSIKDNRSIELSVLEVREWKPDIILLHTPSDLPNVNYVAWTQLNRLVNTWNGVQFGVSNYDIDHINQLSGPLPIPIVNQIEISPFHQPLNLINYCRMRGISIEAHSSLTKGEKFNHIGEMSIAPNLPNLPNLPTPARVLLAWSLHHNYNPIFSSKNVDHFDSNMAELPQLDMADIKRLDQLGVLNYRTHPQYRYNRGPALPEPPAIGISWLVAGGPR